MTASMLIFTYHTFLSLGITDGLMIKLPGYYIKKQITKIINSLSISAIYISAILILSNILILLIFISDRSNLFFITILLYGIATVPYQFYYHYLLLNRFTYNFGVTKRARLLIVFLRIFLQIPLLLQFGLIGVVSGELIVYSVAALYIQYLSDLKLSKYFSFENFKSITFFGLPILIINIVGLISATLEKLIASIFLDFQAIANIGTLTFIGSIFLIISSQLLSLFSQYSREFIVKKPSERVNLFGSYLAFIQISSLLYVIFSALLFHLLDRFLIPNFAIQYTDIIIFFGLVFLLFYIRIILAGIINFLLILGERSSITISHILFISCSIIYLLVNILILNKSFNIEIFITSLVIGALFQSIFCFYIVFKLLKQTFGFIWIFLSIGQLIFLVSLLYSGIFSSWLFLGLAHILTFSILNFIFLTYTNLCTLPKNFLYLLNKEYM